MTRLRRLVCRVFGHRYRFVDDCAFRVWMAEAEPGARLTKGTIEYFIGCRRCGQ